MPIKICYKLLYVTQTSLIGDFLAPADIKTFGCTYLFAMLLLIGLALVALIDTTISCKS